MSARRAGKTRLLLILTVAACGKGEEIFTDKEWEALEALGNPPDPPPDTSNKYLGNPAVIALGKQLYFDGQLSGPAQYVDMLGRPTTVARAPLGQEMGISCNTCHDVTRGGTDVTSFPRNVSIGAGAYDVSAQQTVNAAYAPLLYWNGRNDSLWSQIVAVEESDVSMGGDRMKVLWRLADGYRAAYDAAFPDWPLPSLVDGVAAQKARLKADGTCVASCPNPYCHEVTVAQSSTTYCLPRFPLRGKPGYEGMKGYVTDGTLRQCQRGVAMTPAEPWDDAYDCMELADQRATTRIYVNFAKAIAAYEYTLLSRDSAFDRFVAEGPQSTAISDAAKRGARLFVGKAACVDCHNGPLLSDGKFHAIGVPQTGPFVPAIADCPAGGWCDCVSDDTNSPRNCLPNGAREGLRKLQSNKFRRDSFFSDDPSCQNSAVFHIDPSYADAHPTECDGRVRYYSEIKRPDPASWIGKWRTPSLRDVALTAPYMHNGMYPTLLEVVWHYNGGGQVGGDAPGVKDPRLAPLHLSDAEMADLVELLKTLTGRLPAAATTPPALPAPSPF